MTIFFLTLLKVNFGSEESKWVGLREYLDLNPKFNSPSYLCELSQILMHVRSSVFSTLNGTNYSTHNISFMRSIQINTCKASTYISRFAWNHIT